jgi:flagellar biosynthesis GTPase FlhF
VKKLDSCLDATPITCGVLLNNPETRSHNCKEESIWRECGNSCDRCQETRDMKKPKCEDANPTCSTKSMINRCGTEEWVVEQCPVSCGKCEYDGTLIPVNHFPLEQNKLENSRLENQSEEETAQKQEESAPNQEETAQNQEENAQNQEENAQNQEESASNEEDKNNKDMYPKLCKIWKPHCHIQAVRDPCPATCA